MVKADVLAALDAARGKYISGQELAQQLGVSRTAIWKAVAALRADGIPVAAVTNRGYILSPAADVLNAAAVTAVRDRVLALLARPGHTAEDNLAAALAFARAAQRLLDRHRIAALAAGKVPAAVDAAPEPMTPAALAAAFASPEPLDSRWPELLRRVAALPASPPFRMTAVQRTCLAQTIVWRHGMDALDDRDVVFPVRYAVATLLLLACLGAVCDCTDAQLALFFTRVV